MAIRFVIHRSEKKGKKIGGRKDLKNVRANRFTQDKR